MCQLAQDSIVVSGRDYPSGLRTTGARVDRISTRLGTLSTVGTGFPERSLGLLPLPQWGLSVWNHAPWVLLTSQLRFRRNVDQVSGVATSHKPFTQPLTGKKGSFLWDRKYLLRFVTARPLMSGGTSRRGWYLSMPPSDCRMTSEPPMVYSGVSHRGYHSMAPRRYSRPIRFITIRRGVNPPTAFFVSPGPQYHQRGIRAS